jgi:hypothetical protein
MGIASLIKEMLEKSAPVIDSIFLVKQVYVQEIISAISMKTFVTVLMGKISVDSI